MVALVLLPGMDGTGELFGSFIDAIGNGVRPIIISYPVAPALSYAASAPSVIARPCQLAADGEGDVGIALAVAIWSVWVDVAALIAARGFD